MGLPTNNKGNSKLPGNSGKANNSSSKFITKPSSSKAVGATKKPIKTGGARGS